MKKIRNSIAMLLVICLVLAMSANGLSALAQDYTYHYVSLGASQTNGYGLQGYLPITVNNGQVSEADLPLLNGLLTGQIDKNDINVFGYQRAPEGGYPDLIRDALEAQGHTVLLDQMAISSMRVEELRMLLDNEYYGDAYTNWRFYDENGNGWFSAAAKQEGMTNAEALASLRQQYQTAIADADLITVDIGVNNFGVYLINRISTGLENPENAMYSADFSDIFSNEEDMAAFQEAYDNIKQMVVEYVGEDYANLQFLVDTFAYAYIGFCFNFNMSMDAIYDLNPEATVVVVELQNLLEGVTVDLPDVEESIPVDKIYGAVVNMANLYMAMLSPYAESYYFAEAGNVSLFLDDILAYNGDPSTLTQDMRDCFGLYDNDLFGWELFMQYVEYPGQDISAGTAAVYGALAQIAKACAEKNHIDIESLSSLDEAEAALAAFIEKTMQEAFAAGMRGEAYQVDRTVLDNPDYATAMAIAIRFTLGNSFYAHPSRAGHQERANIILDAVANETYGGSYAIKTIIAMAFDVVDVMDYYENQPYYYAVEEGSYYLALGDDVAAAPGSYVEKLAAELGVNYKNLAQKGGLIEDAFDVVEANKKLIRRADLITLGYSNNAAAEAFLKTLVGLYQADNDWASIVKEENLPLVEEILAGFREFMSEQEFAGNFLGMNLAELLPQAIENYAYLYASILMNNYKVAKAIHEINPDAQVVIIGAYNDLEDVVLSLGAMEFPLGNLVSRLTKVLAIGNVAYSSYADNTAFIYAPDVETVLDKNAAEGKYDKMNAVGYIMTLVQNSSLRLPTDAGHTYIMNQILATMTEPPVGILGDINGDGMVNSRDAKEVLLFELGKADTSVLNVAMGDVNGDGEINSRDAKEILRFELGLITKFPAEK